MPEFLSHNVTLICYLIAAAAGLSVASLAWLVSTSVSDVPLENRDYKDPPPLGFRIAWWPIQWIGHYLPALVTHRMHSDLMRKLRRAGLDYRITSIQFISARIFCAFLSASISWWCLNSFEGTRQDAVVFSTITYFQVALAGALFGWLYPVMWLRDRLALRRSDLLKTLPFFLDIITLCVEAGLNMQGAISQAVAKGPKGILREELQRVMRDIRSGKPRATALRDMAQRLGEPGVTNFTTAVIQADSMGLNLGPVLRAQADQRRSERFLRAEKLAMEAPVKMLFPLIAFIFPCTFVVLFFPIVMKFMNAGL
jgi:tight adherence protein C